MRLIGFAGKAGAGKDAAARILMRERDFCTMALADEMKRFAVRLWGWDYETLWGESAKRNAPDPRFGGLTPRRALQFIGTEIGRELDGDVWVRCLLGNVRRVQQGAGYNRALGVLGGEHSSHYAGVAVPDVRFPNEVAAIREAGGRVVWIERGGLGLDGPEAEHRSENSIMVEHCDSAILNSGTLEDLKRKVLGLIDVVPKRAVIESPLSGDFARNQRYARLASVDAMRRGYSPYASHLYFTQMLNDATPEDRRLGMTCGFAWGDAAEICLVYEDLGISNGMREGIARARARGLRVEHLKLPPDLMSQLDGDATVSLRPTEGAL